MKIIRCFVILCMVLHCALAGTKPNETEVTEAFLKSIAGSDCVESNAWKILLQKETEINDAQRLRIALSLACCQWRAFRPAWAETDACNGVLESVDLTEHDENKNGEGKVNEQSELALLRLLHPSSVSAYWSVFTAIDRIDRYIRQNVREDKLQQQIDMASQIASNIATRQRETLAKQQASYDVLIKHSESLENIENGVKSLAKHAVPALETVQQLENMSFRIQKLLDTIHESTDVTSRILWLVFAAIFHSFCSLLVAKIVYPMVWVLSRGWNPQAPQRYYYNVTKVIWISMFLESTVVWIVRAEYQAVSEVGWLLPRIAFWIASTVVAVLRSLIYSAGTAASQSDPPNKQNSLRSPQNGPAKLLR